MYEWSLVGMTADQASEAVNRMLRKCFVSQIDWKQIEDRPDLKVKGDKRNGTMSRQQAFGKLFRKRGK